MKKRAWSRISFVLLLAASTAAQAQVDPLIQAMVGEVSQANLTVTVQALQDFQTRHTYTQANSDAGDWLFAEFAALGLEVERHGFTIGAHQEDNIVARIVGETLPEEIVIISGHFDSTSDQPTSNAPGADDDASAIAGVLEAARIFKDFRFERTIEFMCFNGEEQGRRGSAAIASDYLAAGKDIHAVVNSDMIGYWPTGWQRDLDVAYEPLSEWVADRVVAACDTYVGIPIGKKPTGVCQDDHYAFTLLGIPAVTNMDCWEAHNGGIGGESTPHYHRTTDTLATLNLPCMTQAVQVNVAAVADLAGPLTLVGIPEDHAGDPSAAIRLLGNRPNPFNPRTEIRFQAVSAGSGLTLRIFSASGELLREIDHGAYAAGRQGIVWDGRNGKGDALPSGVYLYQLSTARSSSATGKAILLK